MHCSECDPNLGSWSFTYIECERHLKLTVSQAMGQNLSTSHGKLHLSRNNAIDGYFK